MMRSCSTTRLLALAAGLILSLSGCSGGAESAAPLPEAKTQWIRGTWSPLAEPPSKQGERIAAFNASDFDSAWRVEKGPGRVELPMETERSAVQLSGAGARLASFPVDLTASDLHRATVDLDIPAGGKELFRLSFQTAGRTRAYTDVATVSGVEGPERLDLDLAQVRPLEGRIDRIVCETLGNAQSSTISLIEFYRQSPLAHLPNGRDAAGALVHVGDDGRRGVALDAAHPVSLELKAPAGAAFEFAYRIGPKDQLGGAELVVEGLEAAPLRLALDDLDSGDAAEAFAWRTHQRPLKSAAAGALTFRVEGGPEEAVAFVADAGALVTGAAADDPPPTVVLITSDTHRGELLGLTSDGLVRTPALDALGRRGLVFTDASATSNSTNPSHIALMTGLHPRDTHVVTNRDPVARDAHTLAERFAAAGWRTAAAFSAFHLGDPTSGLGQGFDRYDGPGAPTGLGFDAFAGAASAVRNGELTVARALDQVAGASGAPLFLWVHVFDAHAPYFPRGEFEGRYRPEGVDPRRDGPGMPLPPQKVPPFLQRIRDPNEPWYRYRALVDYVDHLLTPLLKVPRVEAGITAFTSDHGESFGEHGIWWNHAGVYPATTHVPLVIAWPGAEPTTIDAPVEQRDLGRTLLALADLDDGTFEGRDLRAAAEGATGQDPRFSLGYFARSASMDDGRWYLVLHLLEEENDEGTHTWKPGEIELYDRRADRACEVNLVAEELDRARLMRQRLLSWLASGDEEGLKAEYHVKAAIDRALAELGYAGSDGEGQAWYDPDRGDAFLETYRDR